MSGVKRLNLSRITKAARGLFSETIYYDSAGKRARDIVRARKGKQTKNYKDAIKAGYRYFGKSGTAKGINNAPKYKIPKTPKNSGIGWK